MNLILINKIEKHITSYKDSDYRQLLETIFKNIDDSEYKAFYEMMLKAYELNKKLIIIENNLNTVNWDGFGIELIKMK